MTRMSPLRLAFATSLCALPLQAIAQTSDGGFEINEKPAEAVATAPISNNWVTIGGQYDSARSYYLGRYSGAVNPGFYGLGDFHFGQRDPWDSGGTQYWEAEGANLGLWDRSFAAKVGQQGTWGLGFYYQGIPYYATDSFKSVFQGNGGLVPGVAPGGLGIAYSRLLPANGIVNSLWIPRATNPPTGLLFNDTLSTRRDVFGGNGKYQWGDWTITGAWRHEHKTGWQANSFAIGGVPSVTTAGTGNTAPTAFTSGLAYFAQPIDYDTDRYDLTAAYATERMQVQLGYTFSQFTDNITTFNLQNPFAFTPTTSFGGPVRNLSAIMVAPPSNLAHQVRAMFGYNFDPTTRLNANFGFGLQMQNASLQAGMGNLNVAPQVLPRSSFDGMIDNFFGNVALTSQPLPNLDLRLAYTMDDRSNHSSRNSWLVFPTSASNASFTYFNLPYSYQRQAVTAEAGYRLGPQTKVTLDDTLDFTYRTYANTSQVAANRITAKVRGPIGDWAFGSLSAAHEDRVAHNYNSNAEWSLLCNTCNAEPANFIMFFEASRKHDEIKGTIDLSPTNAVTASLVVKFANDHYPDTTYGLRNNHNLSIGPDVSWQVTNAVAAHAFYTYQQLYYDQSSIYESSTTVAPNLSRTGTGFVVPWSAKTTDSVHTVGANLDWQAISDVLKFSLDYNFSYGDTAYAFGEGVVAFGGAITSPTFQPSIALQPLPDIKSMLSVISLHGEYTFMPNVTLLFGYAWERFTYKDFMVGTPATQFANALLPGTLSPNDSVHVVSAALRLRF